MVEDPSNWKMPINAAIPEYMRDAVEQAVIFFAGCRPVFTPVNPKARKANRRLNVKSRGLLRGVWGPRPSPLAGVPVYAPAAPAPLKRTGRNAAGRRDFIPQGTTKRT